MRWDALFRMQVINAKYCAHCDHYFDDLECDHGRPKVNPEVQIAALKQERDCARHEYNLWYERFWKIGTILGLTGSPHYNDVIARAEAVSKEQSRLAGELAYWKNKYFELNPSGFDRITVRFCEACASTRCLHCCCRFCGGALASTGRCFRNCPTPDATPCKPTPLEIATKALESIAGMGPVATDIMLLAAIGEANAALSRIKKP